MAKEFAKAEHAQARQRIIIAGTTAFCMLIGTFSARFDPSRRLVAIEIIAVFCVCSLGFLVSVWAWPGPSLLRRVLAMAHDYGGLALIMVVGGEIFLPACAILMWITVGYGLRYGLRYLLAATALSLLSLGTVYAFTPYWRDNPYILATLLLMTVLVPAYAYRLLANLRDARDAAAAANLAKSRFLAHASHDLRQPIHATALLTACLRDTDLQPDQRELVDDIDRSLRGVASLFRSLLDVSSLDSGGIVPRISPVAVNDILGDLLHRNAEAARWAGVDLRLVKTAAWATTDAQLLATIVQNILSNAIKYAPGKPVLIGCRRRAGSLAIAVVDRGPGIPEQHVDHIFEEFYRGRSFGDADIEGMGLGLSIVRRLAELLGLQIELRSTPGRGTTVIVEGLHLVDRSEIARDIRAASHPGAPLDGLRVVLVEDDRVTLAATRLTLERWGCSVQAFSRIPGAIGPCDVLVTDFDLGHRSTAIECIGQVRGLAGSEIPAIVISGHEMAIVRDGPVPNGVTILAKPLQLSILRAVLARHVPPMRGEP